MPVKIFCCYAHKDESLLNKLKTQLIVLERQGLIEVWYDRDISAGTEWNQEIREQLNSAHIILLLISPDFMTSDYINKVELNRALERHESGEARVIPVILRPVLWRVTPVGKLQALPKDGIPVTDRSWHNLDEAFFDVAKGIHKTVEQQTSPVHPVSQLSPFDRQYRGLLLKRVHATWIDGVLEQSLHKATLIALDLQERHDALANPWHLEVQETNIPPHSLPTGTLISDVYKVADGMLLILGEPGAGKTTLLLELARTLLKETEKEEQQPVPVLFPLSSWAVRQTSLSEWLVEELWHKYRIPQHVGETWVSTNRILPLLDGLDEVPAASRPACVQKINTYAQEHLGSPLVVCCRTAEFNTQTTRVWMNKAVVVQPLTKDQIEEYLSSAQDKLEGVRRLIKHDPEMQKLATTPLMLSILTLAYQDKSPDMPVAGMPLEALRDKVFAAYIDRMLTRGKALEKQESEHFMRWLTALAVGMQNHRQTTFYLEYLQAGWLAGWGRRLLYRLTVGLFAGLFAGLIAGLSSGLVVGVFAGPSYGPIVGLGYGLVVGLLVMLISTLVYGFGQIRPREVLTWSEGETKQSIVVGLSVGLGVGLLVGLGYGLVVGHFAPPSYGPHAGLISGLIAGLSSGLVVGVVVGLAYGFSRNRLNDRMGFTPNQGIWHSASNGLVTGLSVGLSVGLVIALLVNRFLGPGTGPNAGLFAGLFAGLLTALSFGLGSFFQHFALRFWLWCAGCFPRNMVAFLDEAAKRLLLRKVGGGYIFVHSLLLDYFASLAKDEERKGPKASSIPTSKEDT